MTMQPRPTMSSPVPAPRSEELLAHAHFLRRLAARLVGPDEAADVVQEAFATALASPPRARAGQGSLRGWLAIVVTNLARNRRRATGRREERERRASRPERVDAHLESAQALERLELQRLLGELVVALPEEQRTVLYLRYFEDLRPAAIAARLGVPGKTIESRHTRGLAALRRALDERSGGDRAAWVSALAPWVRTGGGAASATIALKAAAALVLLLGGWLGWRALSAPLEPVPVPSVASSTPVDVPMPVDVTEAREPVAPGAAPAPVKSTARLSGRVRAADDAREIAGVPVSVRIVSDGAQTREEGLTDESGAFRFEWSTATTVLELRAGAGPTTSSASRFLQRRIAPGESFETELVVSRGATLVGTVLDEVGTPVPDAEIHAWCTQYPGPTPDRRARSGRDGTFRVEHLGEDFVLVAETPELACRSGLRGTLVPGTTVEGLVVELAPAQPVRGTVVDEWGRPVEGAVLSASGLHSLSSEDQTDVPGVQRFNGELLEARSDASGAFEFGAVAGSSVQAGVSHADFLVQQAHLEVGAENRIVLDPGLTLRGVVRDRAGLPVPGATVRVGDGAGGKARTDEHGEFRIAVLAPAESAYLHVAAEGHAMQVLEPLVLSAGLAPLELRLAPERVLAGRVVGAAQEPLAGALVRIEGEREVTFEDTRFTERTTWEWAGGLQRTYTDADGRFRLGQLYEGEFQLFVEPRDGPKPATSFRAHAGNEALELVVDPQRDTGVVFSGRVRDALTGEPVPRFTLLPMTPDPDGWVGTNHPFEDLMGEFRAGGFAPGPYRVQFKAPGYARHEVPAVDYVAGDARFEVVLHPSCSVPFELVGTGAGGATDNASLRFFDADGGAVPIALGTGATSRLHLDSRDVSSAILPRALVRVVATAHGCREQSRWLDLTTPPVEPVLIRMERDPEQVRTRLHFRVLVSDDAELRATQDLDRLRAGFESGALRPPAAEVALELLDADSRIWGTATIGPLEGELYAWTRTTPSAWEPGELETEAGSSHGPGIELELQPAVRAIRVRSPGCAELTVPLGQPVTDRDEPWMLVAVLAPLD